MTKTFLVPFRGTFTNSPDVEYRIRVTDRMEERDSWKRAVAIDRASVLWNKAHQRTTDPKSPKWCGTKYLLRSKVKELQ